MKEKVKGSSSLDNSPVAQPASMRFGHQTKLKEPLVSDIKEKVDSSES